MTIVSHHLKENKSTRKSCSFLQSRELIHSSRQSISRRPTKMSPCDKPSSNSKKKELPKGQVNQKERWSQIKRRIINLHQSRNFIFVEEEERVAKGANQSRGRKERVASEHRSNQECKLCHLDTVSSKQKEEKSTTVAAATEGSRG